MSEENEYITCGESVEISNFDEANYIMAGAIWQDQLLQSYRNYLLITQSIFLAVAVALISVYDDTLKNTKVIYLCAFLLTVFLGIWVLYELSSALKERKKAVDWWQQELISFEKNNPNFRYFTNFRLAIEHKFSSLNVRIEQLDEEQKQTLRSPYGNAPTRKVFNILVWLIVVAWCVVLVGGIVVLR